MERVEVNRKREKATSNVLQACTGRGHSVGRLGVWFGQKRNNKQNKYQQVK